MSVFTVWQWLARQCAAIAGADVPQTPPATTEASQTAAHYAQKIDRLEEKCRCINLVLSHTNCETQAKLTAQRRRIKAQIDRLRTASQDVLRSAPHGH